MSENYIVINGKKMDLTEEQLKALGIEARKNPFERVKNGREYYCINETGEISSYWDCGDSFDNILHAESNYFSDETFAHQVGLHQLLYRKLLKFAYDNEAEDRKQWNGFRFHPHIAYDIERKQYVVCQTSSQRELNTVYFDSIESTNLAIAEVVEPFIKEHPDFAW